MNIAVIKTKAEMALVEEFAKVEARLPGNDAVAHLRRDAIGRFASLGLPHRRVEEWKYTDLRTTLKESYPRGHGGIAGTQLIAEVLDGEIPGLFRGLDASTILLVDGAFVTSTLNSADQGIECLALDKALDGGPDWVQRAISAIPTPADGVLALNTAYMSGGVALRIADGVQVAKPIHIVFLSSGAAPKAVTTRMIVSVGRGAKVTFIESHLSSLRQDNTVTQLEVGEAADVTHVKNLDVCARSIHLASWLVRMGANAAYRPFQFTTGTGVSRNSLDVAFAGPHSMIDLGTLSLGRDSGHADTTMVIDHAVPHCTSRELYKCVLDGRARAVFQGKVIVRPDAQKTDGKQMARALLLSPDAEFNSKPELEIYADDVVCGHGTTSMELDDDLLFYCQTRGIPTLEARTLLIESFIGEAIDKLENEALRDGFMAKARAWLTAKAA